MVFQYAKLSVFFLLPTLLSLVALSNMTEFSSLPSSSDSSMIQLDEHINRNPSWLTAPDKKLLGSTAEGKANLTVAKDGSRNFATVKDAVAAAPDSSMTRYVIYVKKGIYNEIVHIGKKKTNITLIGDSIDSTVITGSLNYGDGIKTYYSATLAIDGNGFMAQDMCIRNTAGPEKGQAVALRISADRAVVYRCRIDGYQDTLYAHQGRQFYRDCYITGTVDFIFGRAAGVFQYCQIVARKPSGGQSNMITAQSREGVTRSKSGFSFQKCNITASSDLAPIKGAVKTFLGRPWGVFSTVVIMESFIDDIIDPTGWHSWKDEKEGRLSTLYYGEYQNKSPGADTSRRVDWKGFKVIKDRNEASKFTVGQLLQGASWLNSTGVPYDQGL